jgi:hypothetical protein
MYCTPWGGCNVAFFYYEDVQVVASSGHLDVDGSGWWGNRGGCAECEFETLEPPEHPEPVDPGGEPPPACGDERDTMITEYSTHNVNLSPICTTFENVASRFIAAGDSHGSWGIDRGLGVWLSFIQEHSGLSGNARVTSGYRCPHRNASIAGAASQSRHMYGDALDLYPPPDYPTDLQHYTLYRNSALQSDPGYITEWDTYADRHLHVDWRSS